MSTWKQLSIVWAAISIVTRETYYTPLSDSIACAEPTSKVFSHSARTLRLIAVASLLADGTLPEHCRPYALPPGAAANI